MIDTIDTIDAINQGQTYQPLTANYCHNDDVQLTSIYTQKESPTVW